MRSTFIRLIFGSALIAFWGSSAIADPCDDQPVWSPNSYHYTANFDVFYSGRSYRCIQDHMSRNDRDPHHSPRYWRDRGPCPRRTHPVAVTHTATRTPTRTPIPSGTPIPDPLPTQTGTPPLVHLEMRFPNWEVGQTVSYVTKQYRGGLQLGEEKTTYSIVGESLVGSAPLLWLEVETSPVTASATGGVIRKFLVPPVTKTILRNFLLEGTAGSVMPIEYVYQPSPNRQPLRFFVEDRIQEIFGSFLENQTRTFLMEVYSGERIGTGQRLDTPGGRFRVEKFASRIGEASFTNWFSEEVPLIGLVKFVTEFLEPGTNSPIRVEMVIVSFSMNGAESRVTVEPALMTNALAQSMGTLIHHLAGL